MHALYRFCFIYFINKQFKYFKLNAGDIFVIWKWESPLLYDKKVRNSRSKIKKKWLTGKSESGIKKICIKSLKDK